MGGCAGKSSPVAESMAAMYSAVLGSNKATVPSKFNPAYRYLYVEVPGSPISATLVLGYLDSTPVGSLETWYSASNEVIKIQNGRIVATTGLQFDWASTTLTQVPPDWSKIDERGQSYSRVRDVMPDYRFGIREQITVQRTEIPKNLPATVSRRMAEKWAWFRETQASTTDEVFRDSIFALGQIEGATAIVYSEQCLSSTFCLRLQSWPSIE